MADQICVTIPRLYERVSQNEEAGDKYEEAL